MRRLAIVLCLVFAALPARADGVADAKTKFDQGGVAFSQRRYADAANAWEEAAVLSPHPAPLVNASEAWELDGNFVRAARAGDAARVLATDKTLRAQIDRRLARLERRIATLEVDGAPALRIRVDDAASVAPPARVRLSPGTHTLAVSDSESGESHQEEVAFAVGETRHLVLAKTTFSASDVLAKPAEAPPPPPALPPARSSPPLGTWIAGGVAVAAVSTATVFGVLTLNAQSAFDAHPTDPNADRFEDRRTVTNLALAAFGVAAIVAAAFWVLAPKTRTSTSAVR